MFVFLSFCLQNDLPKASTCASSVSGARLSFGLSPDFPNPLGTLTEHQCNMYMCHMYIPYTKYTKKTARSSRTKEFFQLEANKVLRVSPSKGAHLAIASKLRNLRSILQ